MQDIFQKKNLENFKKNISVIFEIGYTEEPRPVKSMVSTVGEDGVSEQIKCQFQVDLFWNDPRLVNWPEGREIPATMFG